MCPFHHNSESDTNTSDGRAEYHVSSILCVAIRWSQRINIELYVRNEAPLVARHMLPAFHLSSTAFNT